MSGVRGVILSSYLYSVVVTSRMVRGFDNTSCNQHSAVKLFTPHRFLIIYLLLRKRAGLVFNFKNVLLLLFFIPSSTFRLGKVLTI